MNKLFIPQQQEKQQLNSTGRYDDCVVSTIEESVANKEKEKTWNEKILIVDDEPDITFTLRAVLEENGFKEVDVFNEPLLALQNFKSRVYSLLITDVAMPKMNGFDLYEHIKKIDARIKVVFMTASKVNYEVLNELLQADRFEIINEEEHEERSCIIRKPVEIKEFIQRVNNELQTTQPIQGTNDTRFRSC
jgi:CheY-like chemotaxis protein